MQDLPAFHMVIILQDEVHSIVPGLPQIQNHNYWPELRNKPPSGLIGLPSFAYSLYAPVCVLSRLSDILFSPISLNRKN